jgi:hypothetical protein
VYMQEHGLSNGIMGSMVSYCALHREGASKATTAKCGGGSSWLAHTTERMTTHRARMTRRRPGRKARRIAAQKAEVTATGPERNDFPEYEVCVVCCCVLIGIHMWDEETLTCTRPGVHQARLGCVPATSCPRISPILAVRDSDMVSLLCFEQQVRRKMDQPESRRDAAVNAGMDYWT